MRYLAKRAIRRHDALNGTQPDFLRSRLRSRLRYHTSVPRFDAA
ncbi:Uncharacterized protein pbN1_33270 [Aromatoleum bremense]|nr:Uncharacterized protein pbN1_33270 [Aromatoleum bremense]